MLRRIGAVVALGAGMGLLACQAPSDTRPGPAETHVEIARLLTEVYEYEWWHFDYSGWEKYRIGNDVFEDLRLAQPAG